MSTAFRTLSMGVGSFDRSKLPCHVDVFRTTEPSRSGQDGEATPSSSKVSAATLPPELDFFGSSDARAKSTSKSSDAAASDDAVAQQLAKSSKKRKRGEAAQTPPPPPPPPLTADTLKAYLREHRLNISGIDYPLPLTSWAEARTRYDAPEWCVAEMQNRGWEMTGVQRGAMPVALEKRDLLAMAPTGSGKTLAYLFPLLHHLHRARESEAKSEAKDASTGPRALILSPTRELATQIYDETRRLLRASPAGQREALRSAKAKGEAKSKSKKSGGKRGGIRVALLTGGERVKAIEESEKGAASGGAGAKFDVLISTPLRLVQAVEVEGWSLANVTQVVLDEADTLLSPAFLKQTDLLLSLCTSSTLQKSLFSATLPSSVEALSRTLLSPDYVRLIVGSKDASSTDVEQRLHFTGNEEGKLLALRTMLRSGEVKPPALLFVQSIQRAKDLYDELVYDGLRLDVIHSERSRVQREAVVSSFRRGEVWLLICTEVLARGLDFKGVELVINYDFPQSTQSYVHRVGRTGRAGRRGRAVTFFTKDDAPYLRSVLNLIKGSAGEEDLAAQIPEYLLTLPKTSKKQKRRLQRVPVGRQGVAEASGSRKAETDARERKEGRRVEDRGKAGKGGKTQEEEAEDDDEESSGSE